MSLSDKICFVYGEIVFKKQDVKEFIRELKAGIKGTKSLKAYVSEVIDELAGKGLIENDTQNIERRL